MNPEQFRDLIIDPVCRALDLWSPAASDLLLGTALHESGGLKYIRQLPDGPALGFYQMEPATHDDCWKNYLAYRRDLTGKLSKYIAPSIPRSDQLIWNIAYATAMARIQYYRKPEALPAADDIDGLAQYWKRHWNTAKGAGTVAQYITTWKRYN